MALFEFQCPACDKLMEAVRPMKGDIEPVICECGATARKKMSQFNFSMGKSTTKSGRKLQTLKDFPDHGNDWIDA